MLHDRFGLVMSHQAISKAPYLPKDERGKIIVREALACLEERGRITLDPTEQAPDLSLSVEEPTNGRPRAKGSALYDEQAKTEVLRREKLQLEIDALKRKRDQDDGDLLPKDAILDAITFAAKAAGEEISRLPMRAGDLTSLARTGGEDAVRGALTKIAHDLRISIAQRFERSLGDEAALNSPLDDVDDV